MNGVAIDWNIDFAIAHILRQKLIPVDINEVYEELIRSCYPETAQVGWMIFDTVI